MCSDAQVATTARFVKLSKHQEPVIFVRGDAASSRPSKAARGVSGRALDGSHEVMSQQTGMARPGGRGDPGRKEFTEKLEALVLKSWSVMKKDARRRAE